MNKQEIASYLRIFGIFLNSNITPIFEQAFNSDCNLVDKSKLEEALYYHYLTNPCLEIDENIINEIKNKFDIDTSKLEALISKQIPNNSYTGKINEYTN